MERWQMVSITRHAVSDLGYQDAFSGLLEIFRSVQAVPSIEEIRAWMGTADISGSDIARQITFSPERYTRNRVFRNEFIELLAIGWMPKQQSLIHDHDGSLGVVRVFQGVITETRYAMSEEAGLRIAEVAVAGSPTIASVIEPDIHKLANTSNVEYGVTIHAYAPPLKGLNIYELGSTESSFLAAD